MVSLINNHQERSYTMSNNNIGRIYNQQRSRRSQTMSGFQKVVGRVNNQLDENVTLENASHKQEIGVVNNEIRRTSDDRKTHAPTSKIIGRIHNQ